MSLDAAAPPPSFTVHCSFCRKGQDDVDKLIAGPGVAICDACIGLCNGILEKLPPGPAKGAERVEWPQNVTSEALLALLAGQEAMLEDVRAQLQRAVDTLRARTVSWEKIGQALGVSRQAAWERFG